MKDIYYEKYLKYKSKYLQLLSSLKLEGGETYRKTTNLDDYKKITWYKNSCYFSVGMWFLWTLIPFREFIYNYSGDNTGFIAIKELFDEFDDKSKSKPESVNINSIYERIFDKFVKRNIGGKIMEFGEQETSSYLIEQILDQTEDNGLLDKIRFIFKTITKCKNNSKEELKEDKLLTYATTQTNIFNEEIENLNIERCNELDLTDPNGIKITKLDLLSDTNEYFIIQFTERKIYSEISKINYKQKIFIIKAIVSYSGELIISDTSSGHYIFYVFDDNGLNPIELDDLKRKRKYYSDDLDKININSLVLYKLIDSEEISEQSTKIYTESKPNINESKPDINESKVSKIQIDVNKIKENMKILVKNLRENKKILEEKIKEENDPNKLNNFKKRLITNNEQIKTIENQMKEL